MAEHRVRVPDIGEGIAEVELVAWHVAEGDVVAEDQALADVMTDKATVEIPSPVAGTVLALGGEVGQLLAVGAELIRLETGGAPVAAAAGSTATRAAAPSTAPAAAPARPPAGASAAPAAPAAPDTRAAPVAAATERRPAAPRGRPVASPAVRARAWELGLDLAQLTPTGPAGRIVQADLDAAVARGAGRPAGSRPAGAPGTAVGGAPGLPGDRPRELRIVGLRRRIAERMQESKRRIPHYSYVEEVDVGALEDLRARLNADAGRQRPRLTLLPFLVRAIVLAVRDWPQVNARLDDVAGVLTEHTAVHAGIATQTDAGLLVPVLRDAQALDLWACADAIARLAAAARRGRATREELTGSTITVSSLGRLGGIASTPVINRPEVAIVGVNRIVTRPVWRDGGVVGRPMMNLSSSFDHRVVDGAVGAGFVQRVRELLEQPALLFVG